MNGIEWVEVRAPTIEEATEVAIAELGLESTDAVDIEIIAQPSRGFLGMGAQEAVIRVKAKAPARRGHARSRGRRGRGQDRSKPADSGGGDKRQRRGGGRGAAKADAGDGAKATARRDSDTAARDREPEADDRADMSIDEQREDIDRFLRGLLEALGLEGDVQTRVEDEVIIAEVLGEQTEALVGPKGSTLHSTLELCRTIIQRRAQGGARIRLDIAGYNERRREALRIYSQRLADKVLEEGGEVMLEPMNAAERKVVHDTIAAIDGVRTYSEGEEPHRSVVVAKEE